MAEMTSNRPYLVRALYEWICDNGLTPYLLVDAGRPGVRVPPQAVKDGKVVLNLAPRAVDRLELADDMVSFQARFNGVAMLVLVPMDAVLAVYAMENGQGMMFPPEPGSDDAGPGPDDESDSDVPPDDPAPEPPPRRPRGGLRVVK
jgi:stringent starvation protein B